MLSLPHLEIILPGPQRAPQWFPSSEIPAPPTHKHTGVYGNNDLAFYTSILCISKQHGLVLPLIEFDLSGIIYVYSFSLLHRLNITSVIFIQVTIHVIPFLMYSIYYIV